MVHVEEPHRGRHPEASFTSKGIELYPKFWKLSPNTQDFVFAHEIGHGVLDRWGYKSLAEVARTVEVDLWDTTNLPFAQSNFDEAFADSFASYHVEGDVKRRYPGWAKIVEAALRTVKTASSSYEKQLWEYLEDLTEDSYNRRVQSLKDPVDFQVLQDLAAHLLPKPLRAKMDPSSTSWVRPVSRYLLNTDVPDAFSDDRFEFLGQLRKWHAAQGSVPNLERELREARKDYALILAATRQNQAVFEKAVKAAIRRAPNWNGSLVSVDPQIPGFRGNYGDRPFDPVEDFSVTVGRDDASFTVFTDEGKVRHVDDILEGGDTEFFKDPLAQADYFNLVKELRKPGSSSRGRDLVLWTARPTKDRRMYEGVRKVPSGIFLTTDPDRAAGIARDLGGRSPRDLWRVVINQANLVETLNTGLTRDYQVTGKGWVPVSGLELIAPG